LLPPNLSESEATFSGWSCYGCCYCCCCRCASVGDVAGVVGGNDVYVVVDSTCFDAYVVDDALAHVTNDYGAIHIIACVVVFFYY
jgi:hypothetical protein